MSDHVFGKGMQRADLAKLTGCNLETIRYYEKIGMMPDPPRTASGYRIYGEDGSVAKIVKLEHAWRRLDGRNDDGFQVAPFPG